MSSRGPLLTSNAKCHDQRLLEGKTYLVADGAGTVGQGIVHRLLDAGARVLAVSHSQDKLTELEANAGGDRRLHTLAGDLHTQERAAELGRRIREIAPDLDGVVLHLGGWWQGSSLIDLDYEQWKQLIASSLDLHFLAAKTFLPLIRDRADATYILISGAAARIPCAGAGPINVAAAGQLMLARVLSVELRGSPVRVNVLVLGTPVKTQVPEGSDSWITGDDVGQYVTYLASPFAQRVHGRTIFFSNRNQLPKLS